MADRLDVIAFREGKGGKPYAVRLGAAVEGKKPGTWNLYLDAMPAPVEGQYKFSIVPQREKREGSQTPPGTPHRDDMDQDVPW